MPPGLAGRNRKINRRYWELFRDGTWTGYGVVTPATGVDAIIACDLTEDFDLRDAKALTARIETVTTAFIKDMEAFLSKRREP